MASYPGAVKSFATRSAGNTIGSAHMNDVQSEITAIEQELVTSGLTNALIVNAGVQFPAVQVASSDANRLDDYREGTWTPVIGGSGGTSGQTYLVQSGLYVKKGQDVTLYFSVQLSAKGTITGNVQLSGLPFAAHATYGGGGSLLWSALAVAKVNVTAEIAAGASVALVYGINAAATSVFTNLVTADIDNSTILRGSLSYRAAA
jgi:hypothetical protein